MNKEHMIYTFNTLLFSLKKKGILFIRMWMDLENITLNEIGQTQNTKLYVWSYHM